LHLCCSKCRRKKLWAETRGGQDEHFHPCPVIANVRQKTKTWHVTLLVDFNHLKSSRFFGRISLLSADFCWKFVTRFLAGSSSFLWHHLAVLCDNHLATLTTTTYVRRSGRITNGTRSGRITPQDSAFSFPAPTHLEWPSQEEPGSGLTASTPVSGVSAPVCTNGVWPPLRPVTVAQKNKPSTMLPSHVQSIDLLMDCTAWRFWTMRQSNGCSNLPRDLVRPSNG